MFSTLDIIVMKEFLKMKNSEIIDVVEGRAPFKLNMEFSKDQIEEFLKNLQDIQVITFWDEKYPEWLRNIYDPPAILYCKGNCTLLKERGLAIVGTRKATSYGKNIAQKFAHEISKYMPIISGLALGIDSQAHLGALEGKGKTIAVLGNGIDIAYPKTNEILYKRILEENGCIVSEYPPKTPPSKFRFPLRNRIIAGLSLAVLVVEAPEKSGALITANYALEYGIDVLAVPGDITRINSKGTNNLILNGARPVISLEDLLDYLGIYHKNQLKTLSDEEKVIYEAIKQGNNTVDKIVESTGIDVYKVLSILTYLSLKGYVIKSGGIYETIT